MRTKIKLSNAVRVRAKSGVRITWPLTHKPTVSGRVGSVISRQVAEITRYTAEQSQRFGK